MYFETGSKIILEDLNILENKEAEQGAGVYLNDIESININKC